MSGGQLVTVGQGTLSPDRHGVAAQVFQGTAAVAVTIALVGQAIAASQGAITGVADGTLTLVGQSITTAQQSVEGSWAQALSGSGLTFSAGTLTVNTRPTNIVGLAVTPAQGTIVASGPTGVTVNITGEEIAFSTGDVGSGSTLLSGLSSTSAAGTATPSVTLPISGQEITSAMGVMAPNQDAVDSRIDSAQGTAAVVATVPLVGSAIAASQGALSITGDAALALTGQAITASAGDIAYGEEFGLSGSVITSAQQNVGAPGGAELTGLSITASQGTAHTDNDRAYALTGQSISVLDGAAVTSYLAFVDGLELTVSIGILGDQERALVGESVSVEQGTMTASGSDGHIDGHHHHPRPRPHHHHQDDDDLMTITASLVALAESVRD